MKVYSQVKKIFSDHTVISWIQCRYFTLAWNRPVNLNCLGCWAKLHRRLYEAIHSTIFIRGHQITLNIIGAIEDKHYFIMMKIAI